MKILNGLNSSTFNYFEINKKELQVGSRPTEFPKPGKDEIDTRDFFTWCVSFNRPCALKGVAKKWEAYKSWGKSLHHFNATVLGPDQKVHVYSLDNQ